MKKKLEEEERRKRKKEEEARKRREEKEAEEKRRILKEVKFLVEKYFFRNWRKNARSRRSTAKHCTKPK